MSKKKATNSSKTKLLESESTPIQLRTDKLRHTNIVNYSADDVRFMLIQAVVDENLIHRALDYLNDDILLDALYYSGDLLFSMLSLPPIIWQSYPAALQKFKILIEKNKILIADTLDLEAEADRNLKKSLSVFIETYV